MSGSLEEVLSGVHDEVQQRLSIARTAFGHPGTKGDASEGVWLGVLQTYLPERYRVARAHVVDSGGAFSDQIDIVIFDRQYSPFVFSFGDKKVVPAESVYAVFEAKQTITTEVVRYAQSKAESVRKLHRTSLPIPYAGGTYEPKVPGAILAGLVTLESEWSPALGEPLKNALQEAGPLSVLDIGCAASHGVFTRSGDSFVVEMRKKPATAFLLELIARLQELATVPMIDVRAYARWLE